MSLAGIATILIIIGMCIAWVYDRIHSSKLAADKVRAIEDDKNRKAQEEEMRKNEERDSIKIQNRQRPLSRYSEEEIEARIRGVEHK